MTMDYCPNCGVCSVNKKTCYLCKTKYGLASSFKDKKRKKEKGLTLPMCKEVLPMGGRGAKNV